MKINQRAFTTGLKMTSKSGILAFTILGSAFYLVVFWSLAHTSPEPIVSWELLIWSIGGIIYFNLYYGSFTI